MVDEFKIHVDYDNGVIPIIHIAGEITSEADEEIAYINSAGIATLISLITKAAENQGKIEFSGLNSHFRKVMDIVGLTDFVLIHDNIEQALK